MEIEHSNPGSNPDSNLNDNLENSHDNDSDCATSSATHEADRVRPSAPHDRATTTLLTRHEGGFAAQGPGFFVWDRSPAEVIRIAEALQAGRFSGSTTARFLVMEPGDVQVA